MVATFLKDPLVSLLSSSEMTSTTSIAMGFFRCPHPKQGACPQMVNPMSIDTSVGRSSVKPNSILDKPETKTHVSPCLWLSVAQLGRFTIG